MHTIVSTEYYFPTCCWSHHQKEGRSSLQSCHSQPWPGRWETGENPQTLGWSWCILSAQWGPRWCWPSLSACRQSPWSYHRSIRILHRECITESIQEHTVVWLCFGHYRVVKSTAKLQGVGRDQITLTIAVQSFSLDVQEIQSLIRTLQSFEVTLYQHLLSIS